jgi:hypothetical protein
MLIRYIKNLISEIVKLKKESVIQDYMRGVELHDNCDKYIKTWIKNILCSINGTEPNIPISSVQQVTIT